MSTFAIMMCSVLAQPQSQPQPTSPAPAQAAQPARPAPKDGATVVKQLAAEAGKIAPLMESDLARAFLAETPNLPAVATRTVYRDRDANLALSADAWKQVSAEAQAKFKPRECSPEFFYYTGYGSPLVYARVVDLMGKHGVASLKGTRVLDFGYGTLGHLRLMAQNGAEAHGVEIEPIFEALYSLEDRTVAGKTPSVFLHTGQWPAHKGLAAQVAEKGAFDVITSKNTLKKGYIHPEPPAGKTVDERQLVKLGVDDAVFLATVRESLKPGGLFIIYNICPAQTPADDATKPYLPHADGRSPFTREQYEAAGLEVIAFDQDDQAWTLKCWQALGYDGGKPAEQAVKETFCLYTVVRRK